MFLAGLKLFLAKPAESFMGGVGLGLAGMIIATLVGNSFGDRWTYIEETGFTWVIVAMAIRCMMILKEQAATEQAPEVAQPALLRRPAPSRLDLQGGLARQR